MTNEAEALRQYHWTKVERGRRIVRPFTAAQAAAPGFDPNWRLAMLDDLVETWGVDHEVVGAPRCHASTESFPRPDHHGETAWIVASGPSVTELDLRQLEGRLVFACNRAFRHPRAPSIVPYITAVDDRVFEWEHERFYQQAKAGASLITLGRWSRPVIHHFKHVWQVPGIGHVGWSHDLTRGYYTNSSVVFLALQFAAWAGCARAVLLGVDLEHGQDGRTHFFGRVPRNVAIDPQNLLSMQACFALNAPHWEAAGLQLFNCSPTRKVIGASNVSFEQALDLEAEREATCR